MNLIQRELNNAKQRMLALIPDTEMVALTSDNVSIIEAILLNDSGYLKSSDRSAKPLNAYRGSTAYWISQLKPILFQTYKAPESEYEAILSGAIEAIDRENSTHLNADGVGRSEMLQRIMSIKKADLLLYLKSPENTGYWLIEYLSKPTSPVAANANEKGYHARKNISFASKFCHYACFYLFEGLSEQDNYSIYDNVLKKVLPRYAEYYGVSNRNLNNYGEYQKTIDDIIRASNANISRNGFDHLLWYYFKGRI